MKYIVKKTMLIAFSILFASSLHAQAGSKPNIIWIVSDDLNDYIEILGGHQQVLTPNLNELAASGISFTNAYCNAPICAPSRTSMLSGKDLLYTQVYENKTYLEVFRENFTEAKGNEEVITLPEHLKSNGYYTYSINKIFHNYFFADFDDETDDPCEKTLSWNRVTHFNDFGSLDPVFEAAEDGIAPFQFGQIDDVYENDLKDYRAIDTAIKFIDDVAAGIALPCEDAFFLAVGISKPHLDLMIPASYFADDYISNFYDEPFNIPFNQPYNASPANGIIMPPQPAVPWSDYDLLGPVGKAMSAQDRNIHQKFNDTCEDMIPLPDINDTLTDAERLQILEESERANAVMAYIAGVQYMDAQVGRLMDALAAHPELAENTIIIFIGDNGFSLGEKKHWRKSSLWETDIRVPFIIVDPSKPKNKICNRTVSLLDIYPTVCELAGVDYPTFADGSSYLDGQSIVPLLNKVSLNWERPVLSSVKLVEDLEGSCFPQYSVRSERFHYIKYATNNDGVPPGDYCDEAGSITEEELYDIGVNRETDPNEWNNLIDNSAYAPVKNYLENYLPGGDMYLQKEYPVSITNNAIPCLIPNPFTLKLKSKLNSPEGVLVPAAELANYDFKWSNNLTATIKHGVNINFKTSTIPPAVFAANDRILFYLEVTEISTGKLVAFNTKTFYLNPVNTPLVDFTLANNNLLRTTDITEYHLTGSYTNTSWNFGDGFTTEDYFPDTHTYATTGTYNVTNYVQYGNGCTISHAENAVFFREGETTQALNVFPNPASSTIKIIYEARTQEADIIIMNVLGRVVLNDTFNTGENEMDIDIQNLPAGTYLVMVIDGEKRAWQKIQVIH